MRALRFFLRMELASVGVTFSTAVAYALVVQAFLGADEAVREALVSVTALVAATIVSAAALLPLRYTGALRKAAQAATTQTPLDAPSLAMLYAAPRHAAGLTMLLAVAVLALGALAPATGVLGGAAAAVTTAGAAYMGIGSLVLYTAVRVALRPLVEALAPPEEGAVAPSVVDRLSVRVALAVAVPAGAAALLATLIVTAHQQEVARAQDEVTSQVFSLALGVPRVPGEPDVASGQSVAARVLAAGGVRIAPGVQYPQALSREPRGPEPAWWSVPVALLLASMGAYLGLRTGRGASRDLEAVATRMEVGAGPRPSIPVRGLRLVPEVRKMALALDAVAGLLATMAADQKRALTSRAEAAKLRSFVLAGVSHDLRGPLNAVLGFAGLLLSGVDGAVTAGQKESLEALMRGGKDLLRLVDDLLDAARLDAGRMTLSPEPVAVGDLVVAARRAASERTAGVIVGDPTVPVEGELDAVVQVDRDRTTRALGALLAYALLRPGRAGTVSVRVRDESDGALGLAIQSDGTTPPRETLSQLFDPFDFAPSGARAPAGLGLAVGVAERVLALHGGGARAEAGPDGGLVLMVKLPRA